MKIKPGVIIAGLKIEMRLALLVAEEVYKDEGLQLTVTSALDGDHSAGSYHYYGYAVDIRSRGMNEPQKKRVVKEIQENLPPYYDVINEVSHIHIEYDVEKATA